MIEVPLFDHEAERAVLGMQSISRTLADAIALELPDGADEFSLPGHQEYYRTVRAKWDAGVDELDELTLRLACRQAAGSEEKAYDWQWESLFAGRPVIANYGHFCKIVHSYYLRRKVVSACFVTTNDISAVGNRHERPFDEVLQEALARFERISEMARASAAENASVDDLVNQAFERLMAPIDRSEVLATGLDTLDEIIYGLKPQQLSLIGARPSRGKTALALTIADYVATTSGYPVLFFTLEMSPIELAGRLVLCRAGLSEYVLRQNYAPELIASLAAAREDISRSPIYIRGGEQTLDDIIAASRFAVKKLGIKLVVIDYLGLIEVAGKFERYDILIGHITRRLKKRIAQALNVHVLLCAQLNRKTESESRAPRMSDFRDSDRIAFDADIIILPYQEPQETDGTEPRKQRGFETGKVDLIVDKHRNGRTGVATVWWRAECARFENYVEQDVYVQNAQ